VSNATSNTSDETKDSQLLQSLESGSDENIAPASRPSERLTWDEAGFDSQSAKYDKLSKGDVGYGGIAFATAASAATEGLLAKSLRSLGVRNRPEEDS
jgi:hypothetical protein